MARLEAMRLILAVRNLRTATDFYVNVLGFNRDVGDESDGWSWLTRDHFRVGLGECADAVPASELGDHSYVVYVSVDDIDGLYADWISRGAPIRTRPETKARCHRRSRLSGRARRTGRRMRERQEGGRRAPP
jgi:uncharacterized glyoxalase superfamily protein PhnB